MQRAEKVVSAERLNETFQQTPHVILTSFTGLSVNQSTELRRKVRESGGHYRVIKNRLAKRAAAGTAVEPLAERFQGPCALALHDSDPVALAKVLSDFAKDNPEVELLAGIVDAQALLDEAGLKELAALPGLPELRAQLLALIQTPATSLVRLLGTPATQLARVVDAKAKAEAGDS